MKQLAAVGLIALAGCSTPTSGPAIPAQAITAEAAGKYAIYAMMAFNAYEKVDRPAFPLEQLGWSKIGLDGQTVTGPTASSRTGLAYNLYRKTGTNEVVFAFRGTDSKRDWFTGNMKIMPFGLGSQYDQARKVIDDYRAGHPADKIMVTGHSLGGGLSLSISVRKGIDAVVFDSSPRVSDGIGDKHAPATRVLIYEKGESLEILRNARNKTREILAPENIYACAFDFHGVDKHNCELLARGLVELGAAVNPELAAVLKVLPAPVK